MLDIENSSFCNDEKDDESPNHFKVFTNERIFPFGISRSKTMPPPSTAPSITKTLSPTRNDPNTPGSKIGMGKDGKNSQLRPSSESSLAPNLGKALSESVIRDTSKSIIRKSPTKSPSDSDRSSKIITIPPKPSSSASSLRQVLLQSTFQDSRLAQKEDNEVGYADGDYYEDDLSFEEKVAHLSNSNQPHNKSTFQSNDSTMRSSKELSAPENLGPEIRSNSLDEVVLQMYEDDYNKEEGKNIVSQKFYDNEKSDFGSLFKSKKKAMKYFIVLMLLIIALANEMIFTSFPFFTCHHENGACFPQLTVQITDQSPAAKTALVTVKEALKVLTYLAIDFGDSTSELDILNNRLDTYYQDKVIDTFSVNTVYQLNFLGYCRLSSKNRQPFCMRSYGLDLLAVFVRDAGVQLGQLTKTNIDIMGDSFALAYELAISGFNQFTNAESHSVEYIDYAILLQKFSKGLGFLTVSQFVSGGLLLVLSIVLLILKYRFLFKNMKSCNRYLVKKWLLVVMISLSFLSLLTGFLVCSLTFEYILKLSEVGQNVGIANVNRASGFTFIWISFIFQILSCCFVIYLANGFRKRLF